MKVFLVCERDDIFSSVSLAFSSYEEAFSFVENAMPRKRKADDPTYEIIEMDTEDEYKDKVYLVSALEETYQYDWGLKELYSSSETPFGVFSNKEKARKFLFDVFEQKPGQSILLILKELFVDEKEKYSYRILFRCNYEV